eukprot:885629-Pyramimonas_sp.AAC.2
MGPEQVVDPPCLLTGRVWARAPDHLERVGLLPRAAIWLPHSAPKLHEEAHGPCRSDPARRFVQGNHAGQKHDESPRVDFEERQYLQWAKLVTFRKKAVSPKARRGPIFHTYSV